MSFHHFTVIAVLSVAFPEVLQAEKFSIDEGVVNNYSEFLNFGEKKFTKLYKESLENAIIKSKVDVLGEIFKKNIDTFKAQQKLDLVFLIDGSSSVGESNFQSELKFVKKLLSDVTVDYNHTRVAIVTFSSAGNVIKNIDEISHPREENNKCLLLNRQLNSIEYKGGETYTLGAFTVAQEIFKNARNDSKKVLFLITDGFSNGGDPVPVATALKQSLVTVFTIGIQNGNYKELYELATSPGEFHSYLLDSFHEFESLARRALHVDLKSGDYIPIGINSPCNGLCEEGDCCDKKALCTCGTSTGHYSCVCKPGYYGSGLQDNCLPCPSGTYSNGPNLCLPCPDINHITVPPAVSIESCQCKTGYQSTSDNKCEVVKCPEITNPEHGYFVKKKTCDNVLNSACGIRCEVGYTLVGTSIRLCQTDAKWSGDEPSCLVKTCSKLVPPLHGTMTCSQIDLGITYNDTNQNYPVDTVCSFKCKNGKTLIGSSQRTCLPLARWDGLKTSCKDIKCPKLPKVKYGKLEPMSCTLGKQPHGTKCKITCDSGFEMKGPSEKTCVGKYGSWDTKYQITVCQDVTPPHIECPQNITSSTHLGKSFGTVEGWKTPIVKENSDFEVLMWMEPVISNISGFNFEIGPTRITYFAQDFFHNIANCSFFVTITDDERPVIEDCTNPLTFLTNEKAGANVTWDEPHIFDNSQNITITKSHEFGFFPMGTTTVTYTAVDLSGNKNVCSMNITIEQAHCEALQDPIYGHSECLAHSFGMQCVITCQEGYAVPLSQSHASNDTSNVVSFLCNDTQSTWYNQDGLVFPECSVSEVPKEMEQNGVVSIASDLDTCDDSSKLTDLENDIKITLKEASCSDNCTVKTNTTCEDSEEEITNVIKKREVSSKAVQRSRNKRVNVNFQIRGRYVNETQENLNIYGPYNASIRYQKAKYICPPGFVPRRNRCVQCPKGMFHNTTKNKCQSCAYGYFNDKVGQTVCQSCPLHYSTKKTHSKKLEDCKAECPPGTHAKKRFIKQTKNHANMTIVTERATLNPRCRSCPVGSYQSGYGHLKCLHCPKGFTTLSARSVNSTQCVPKVENMCKKNPNICNGNGNCVAKSDYFYSCSCFENYIGSQCETKLSSCDSNPCLNEGTCEPSTEDPKDFKCICPSRFSGKYCEDTKEKCLLRCLNGGTCLQNDINDHFCLCPSGFGGDTCEIQITYCETAVCENDATCSEELDGFRCECRNGFIGRRCNILPCDYQPCRGNAICSNTMEDNATRSSYTCTCPEGYRGELCDEVIDFCEERPCMNEGTCSSNATTFSCSCSQLFKGDKCEIRRRSDYVLNFKRFSTGDYVKLDGFQKNITEFTVCLWMQTRDNFNYGTLLSYANKNFDNAFTLTDYTGLVLYVNNQYVVTDVLLNDGLWHHFCVTWKSSEGSYTIYVDSSNVKTGSSLANGTHIDGWGNMVLGQEQDIMGGHFSQSETFVGKMAYVDIWARELLQKEIVLHMNDCQNSFFGDMYAWPEMQDHVEGFVEVLNSSFCGACKEPKTMFNGVIDVVGSIAYYKCYKGFQLSVPSYKSGRRCTKAAKWEGSEEPFCKMPPTQPEPPLTTLTELKMMKFAVFALVVIFALAAHASVIGTTGIIGAPGVVVAPGWGGIGGIGGIGGVGLGHGSVGLGGLGVRGGALWG